MLELTVLAGLAMAFVLALVAIVRSRHDIDVEGTFWGVYVRFSARRGRSD